MTDTNGGVLTLVVRIKPGHTKYDLTDSLNEFLRAEGIYPMIDENDDDTGWAYTWLPNSVNHAAALRQIADQLEGDTENG